MFDLHKETQQWEYNFFSIFEYFSMNKTFTPLKLRHFANLFIISNFCWIFVDRI